MLRVALQTFTITDACTTLLHVASGLQFLHSNKIYHGDVRGSNVHMTIGNDGAASYKIANTGLTRLATKLALSLSKSFKGDESSAWFPPEWFTSSYDPAMGLALTSTSTNLSSPRLRSVDTEQSDVYMFGGLMFEMLSGGRRPFFWVTNPTQLLIKRRTHPTQCVLDDAAASLTGSATVPPTPSTATPPSSPSAVEMADPVGWCQVACPTESQQRVLEDVLVLMRQCLASDPQARPTMETVVDKLIWGAAVTDEEFWEPVDDAAAAAAADQLHVLVDSDGELEVV